MRKTILIVFVVALVLSPKVRLVTAQFLHSVANIIYSEND